MSQTPMTAGNASMAIAPPTAGYFPTVMAPPAPAAPAALAAPTWSADQRYVAPVAAGPVAPPPPPIYTAPQQVAGPQAYTQVPQAYSQQPQAYTAQPQPYAAAPQTYGATSTVGAQNLGQGPIVQTGAAGIIATAAKVIPAGTSAAVGAASAIARNTNGTMVKSVAAIVENTGEPLLKLSWALIGNSFDMIGSLLTLRFGDAARAFGKIFSEGAFSLSSLGKKVAQPLTLTAATSGGTKLGLGQAIGAGLSGGMKALKSSFIWAIPASAITAFIDYKYRDQHDLKRLGTNFAADVVGFTATGMAGAAVGAAVGSMTMPIIGTIVGAAVGIGLGLMHDKITRPMLSDVLHDAI